MAYKSTGVWLQVVQVVQDGFGRCCREEAAPESTGISTTTGIGVSVQPWNLGMWQGSFCT
jgi:hypothetical protein